MDDQKLILVDGSGYLFRAYYGLPPLNRPDGTPVNAVFGFSTMLQKLMIERENDILVVIFDAGRKSFRNDMYEDYKANRAAPPDELIPQFPLVRDASRAFGLPTFQMEGYEADDLIATYARMAQGAGRDVIIYSSDKDLMQLVGPGISMHDPMKNIPIGPDEVVKKFGVMPDKVGDILALAGDTSDNVPGVPGIGVKTAAQLLEQFGDLETLLAQAETIKQPKRRQSLIDHAETARLSRRLVALCETVPVEVPLADLTRKPVDPDELCGFLEAQGFRTLVRRIRQEADKERDGAQASSENSGKEKTEEAAEASEQSNSVAVSYETITQLSQLQAIVDDSRRLGRIAVDTETTGLDITTAKLVGVCLSVQPGQGAYLPLAHVDDFGQPLDGQLTLAEVRPLLEDLFCDEAIIKIGHNLKYDLSILARYQFSLMPIADTLSLSYSLNGNKHNHSLDELARRYFDHEMIAFKEIAGSGKTQKLFSEIPIDVATNYGAEDADLTLRLFLHFSSELVRQKLTTIYERYERPLMSVISDMEQRGIKVDSAFLQQLSSRFTQEMARLEEVAHDQAGEAFNLASPKQLGEILFGNLGLPGGKKTKTGAWSTGADVLDKLAAEGHELPVTILEWRQLQKLTRTYCDALVEQVSSSTGRVHTSYALASTSTGRLSSSDPNLQNIPIRTEQGRMIRKAFVPEEGHLLMSADYSQIELRILADMADIQTLKDAFEKGEDIHNATACDMFQIEPEALTSDHRRKAKTINYGIIYGIGAYGLAQRLAIPQSEARDFIAAYFQHYPGIRDFMEAAKAQARALGYVTTAAGRRAYVHEINSERPMHRAGAERAAINAPIQGTAADVMKRAMIRVDQQLRQSSLGCRMLLQVHDELVFEVPESEIEETRQLVTQEMEGAGTFSVPLTVDVGVGKNWDEAH